MRLVRPPASDATSMVRAGLGLWIAAQMWLGLEMLRNRHTGRMRPVRMVNLV